MLHPSSQLDFSWYYIAGALGTWTSLMATLLGFAVRSIVRGAIADALKDIEHTYARKDVISERFERLEDRLPLAPHHRKTA
jgi:hypothetical protein